MNGSEHPDALAHGAARGRAAGLNPGPSHRPGRFNDGAGAAGGGLRLHVLGEHLDAVRAEHPNGVQVATVTRADLSRRLINRVDSPDLPFRWTINPYRGCEHGCIYCYARPTHENLGFSCGLDFETQIMAKPDAPRLLLRELAAPRWRGEPIAMSGVTDAYQPQERTLGITRECLEVMAECRQPVGIVTKSRLVTRDIDLLRVLAGHGAVSVTISLTTLDARLARSMEPRASAPPDRLRAIRELTDAGIPVGVLIAPVIPGLTDHEVPRLLEAAATAGAQHAGWVLLRLPYQVKSLFLEWLAREHPARAVRVERAVRETHAGELYSSKFGVRQRGSGERAEHIARTMRLFARRFGLDQARPPLRSEAFRPPGGLF